MLLIRSLIKSYGNYEVLNMADIHFPKASYWIKGANGSGKSTFLKAIAGITPFKGDVLLNGNISLQKNPVAYRAAISYAPAEPAYPSFLKGEELVQYYMHTKGGNRSQVADLKSTLNIDNYLGNPCGSYSSGMLKKLSLLLAFLGISEWIFLDEPFTTLDAATQLSLQQLIQNSTDKGFIITSHHDIPVDAISFKSIYGIHHKTLKLE
ncbi:ABC transporter ATP-binding protein [Niabella sp. CJ426]|uniref:ABC transporter ATP-binding protein n=1 Tax=Niabella sp. CJ426 TaxID=3393740 RepID=UPI003D028281